MSSHLKSEVRARKTRRKALTGASIRTGVTAVQCDQVLGVQRSSGNEAGKVIKQ